MDTNITDYRIAKAHTVVKGNWRKYWTKLDEACKIYLESDEW
jgi:hypothetical protein